MQESSTKIKGRIGHKATPDEDAAYMLECCARTLLRDYKKHERRQIMASMDKKHGSAWTHKLKRKMMELYEND